MWGFLEAPFLWNDSFPSKRQGRVTFSPYFKYCDILLYGCVSLGRISHLFVEILIKHSTG
jgi:hypothetical protein